MTSSEIPTLFENSLQGAQRPELADALADERFQEITAVLDDLPAPEIEHIAAEARWKSHADDDFGLEEH